MDFFEINITRYIISNEKESAKEFSLQIKKKTLPHLSYKNGDSIAIPSAAACPQ